MRGSSTVLKWCPTSTRIYLRRPPVLAVQVDDGVTGGAGASEVINDLHVSPCCRLLR